MNPTPSLCKAMVHPTARNAISLPYPCSRQATTPQGFCKQHFKVAYKHRLIRPEPAHATSTP